MSVELALRDVRAGYGAVEVLHGVDVDVPTVGLTALLGRNGAGKTTLLSTVAGLLPLRSGQLLWGGIDVAAWTVRERAAAGMLLVPGGRGVFPDLSVRENLEVFCQGPDEQARLDGVLAGFPVLADRLDQRAASMSGGERQLLAMSRVLIQRPRLLLLDEVSFGLAPRIAAQLFDVVAELATESTVVLVEQYVGDALRLADVVYVLDRGRISFVGEPAELPAGPLPV